MAHLRRYLILSGLPLALALAQAAPPPPLQFRVLAIGNPVPFERTYYDLDGQATPIHASDVLLSPLYERKPENRSLLLYKQTPAIPPAKQPGRQPVTDVNLGAKSPTLVILKAGADRVSSTAIDDSWEAFPPGSVRVLSFSKRRIAAQIDGDSAEIDPFSYHIFKYPPGRSRIRVKVASQDQGRWELRYNNSQAVLPDCRVNVVLYDFDPSPGDPNPLDLGILKVVDPLLPPAPAGSAP